MKMDSGNYNLMYYSIINFISQMKMQIDLLILKYKTTAKKTRDLFLKSDLLCKYLKDFI